MIENHSGCCTDKKYSITVFWMPFGERLFEWQYYQNMTCWSFAGNIIYYNPSTVKNSKLTLHLSMQVDWYSQVALPSYIIFPSSASDLEVHCLSFLPCFTDNMVSLTCLTASINTFHARTEFIVNPCHYKIIFFCYLQQSNKTKWRIIGSTVGQQCIKESLCVIIMPDLSTHVLVEKTLCLTAASWSYAGLEQNWLV